MSEPTEEQDETDLVNVCRCCLSKNGEMRSLFGSFLDDMLRQVAQIQVEASDGLPELLCLQCVLQVSRAFRFKQQCQRSDRALRSSLGRTSKGRQSPAVEPAANCALFPEDSSKGCFLLLHRAQVENALQEDCMEASPAIINETSLHPLKEPPFELLGEHHIDSDFTLREEDVPLASQLLNDSMMEHIQIVEDDKHDSAYGKIVPEGPINITSQAPREEAETSSYRCDVCLKTFTKKQVLRRHLKIHDPKKPHVCTECGMSFTESSNLVKHRKKHTGELRNVAGKPNLCPVCGKAFKWATSLSKHMNHHTKRKVLNCPHCPKYYLERQTLKLHLRTHTGERPYVCNVCQRGFTQMCNLEKHLRIHTGEKPYACSLCSKRFTQSSYVAIHMRSHTGEKPYMCNECGKCFAGSNTLAMHRRTHTGERPYCCNTCGKTFARLETATVHQRTHTGEKPHFCTICGRAFISSSHLSNHKRTHFNDNSFQCVECNKRFADSQGLKIHVRSQCGRDLATNLSAKDFVAPPQLIQETILIINATQADPTRSELNQG